MEIRVVLVSPTPLTDAVVALVPKGGVVVAEETEYGHVVSALVAHDDPDGLRKQLVEAAPGAAVAVIAGPLATTPAGLILLDVDSTFTTTEAVDLLSEYAGAGAGARVAEITERAMRGELDFTASLRERVATLGGLPTSVLELVAPRMTLAPGAEELLAAARHAGTRVGLTSGGFAQLVAPMARRHGIDFWNANELETHTVDGVERLTGKVVGRIVDRDQKARDLARFASEHGIDMALTVAVGDGANDLAMLGAAALGVAYCAKPITARQADVAIGYPRLDAVVALALLR